MGLKRNINSNIKLKMSLTLFFLTLAEAESSFLEAEKIVEELHQRGAISQEEKTITELEISTGLSRCINENTLIYLFINIDIYIYTSSRCVVKKYIFFYSYSVVQIEPNNLVQFAIWEQVFSEGILNDIS